MTVFSLRKEMRWRGAVLPSLGRKVVAGGPSVPDRADPATDAVADRVEAVAASGLFDPIFYSRTTGANGGRRALIRHYLRVEPDSRIAPSPFFDASFYRAAYPDAASETDPFLHYVFQGYREQRYPSLRSAEEDARAVKASGEFDEAFYLRTRRGRLQQPDIVLDYLIHGAPEGAQPNRSFDERFVRSYYEALRRGSHNLFAFTCRHRERPWCHGCRKTLSGVLATLRNSDAFDAAFYRSRHLGGRPDLDPLTHYCTEGYMLGFDPSERFSTNQYFRTYPDIARSETNPLHHYERHGKAEGRKSSTVPAVEAGGRPASPDKPWVLIVSHEASLTGAPIVGLKLAERMSDYANVVTWVGRDGPLGERFREASALFVRAAGPEANWHAVLARMAESRSIVFAIVNSVVSRATLPALVDADLPVVALIHEFTEYVKPAGWVSGVALNATTAVVPARVVRASLAKEQADLRVPDEPANVIVRPQGRCELTGRDGASLSAEEILARLGLAKGDTRPTVVLGCGFVQIRKGVDLFVETAQRVKAVSPETVFLWVGGGYKPAEDMAYSVYLADQIERSGLSGTVHLLEEQPDLAPFWQVADLFLLSSRLDPFPNVALDAIVEGLPLICFEGATGIAELAERAPDSVFPVPYLDTAAAADTVLRLGRDARERRRDLASKRPDLAAAFSVADYADALFALGIEARRRHDDLLVEARHLHEDGLFDAAHFQKGVPAWAEAANPLPHRRASDLAKRYVRWREAGMELARPFPGAVPRPDILGREPLACEVHAETVAFAPRSPAIGRAATTIRPVLHAHLGAVPDHSLLDALRRCAAGCTVRLTTDRPDVAHALTERGETGSPSFRITAGPDADPLLSFLRVAATVEAAPVGHLWWPGPEGSLGAPSTLVARALDFYASPDRRRHALERFEADPALGLLFPEHAAVRGSARARTAAGALAGAVGLDLGPEVGRWPVDLVFWAHPQRIPGLRDGRILEASRRQAPAVALQDRLDGFALLLVRLCEAAGSSVLACFDPAENAVSSPVILPQ